MENKNGTTALAARLIDIEIKDFRSNLLERTGVEICEPIDGFSERGIAFADLGEEPAAQKLRAVSRPARENAGRR